MPPCRRHIRHRQFLTGHSPCRALCPPDTRLPDRQAAHPAETQRNAQDLQHQGGNGRTRRQTRHRRHPKARQQRRSRLRAARKGKAQTQAEVIAAYNRSHKITPLCQLPVKRRSGVYDNRIASSAYQYFQYIRKWFIDIFLYLIDIVFVCNEEWSYCLNFIF